MAQGTILSLSICGRFRSTYPDTYSVIADCHRGIGCDQIILINSRKTALTFAFDFITRTAAKLVPAATVRAAPHQSHGKRCRRAFYRNARDRLRSQPVGQRRSHRRYGPALTDWEAIPLLTAMQTDDLPDLIDGFSRPVAVGIGIRTAFFVDNAEVVDIERTAPPSNIIRCFRNVRRRIRLATRGQSNAHARLGTRCRCYAGLRQRRLCRSSRLSNVG